MPTAISPSLGNSYVEVVPDATTDAVIQNTSSIAVLFAFAASAPADSTTSYHTLEPGKSFVISGGIPAGNMYARSSIEDRTAIVVVS